MDTPDDVGLERLSALRVDPQDGSVYRLDDQTISTETRDRLRQRPEHQFEVLDQRIAQYHER